jgi:hypothetical protein
MTMIILRIEKVWRRIWMRCCSRTQFSQTSGTASTEHGVKSLKKTMIFETSLKLNLAGIIAD